MIVTLLEALRTHKSVDNDTIDKLRIDVNKVKLPYLYFLPDISKENGGISLVPLITSQSSATWKIGQFINKILRPYYDNKSQSTTFRDEADFIQKLNHYVYTEHHLRPTTLFCSIKISNFYTLDTHQNMIDIVGYFLQDHLVKNKFEELTILTIKNFPNTMALTETLSNIYLFVWQKKILKQVNVNEELFGRYKDQIFFTWNKSNALQLETFLRDEIREKYSNVRFQKLIGSNVHFLNAFIENRQGQLYTRVFHDSTIQRYTLPYVYDHSKLAYSEWLRSALIRAVCYCSLVEDFHDERIYLELTCLTNGYSLLFVETHIQHFFNYLQMPKMRYSKNQTMYDKFRQKWLDFMDMQHQLTDEFREFDAHGHVVHFNYFYEFGPRCRFNQQFYHLWSQYYKKHPTLSLDKLKILLKTKHYQTLNNLLAMQQ